MLARAGFRVGERAKSKKEFRAVDRGQRLEEEEVKDSHLARRTLVLPWSRRLLALAQGLPGPPLLKTKLLCVTTKLTYPHRITCCHNAPIPACRNMLPLPGAPSSSWALFRQRLATMSEGVDKRVVGSFWLFGEHPSHPLTHFCTLHDPADTINQASSTMSYM